MPRPRPLARTLLPIFVCALSPWTTAGEAGAQAEPDRVPPQAEQEPISVTWRNTAVHEVMLAFAGFSGRSIVVGRGVSGFVTATIEDQPWEAAFEAILDAQGLRAVESESGILRIESLEPVGAGEVGETLTTRVYAIRYVPAAEMQATLAPLLTERGTIGLAPSTNALVVTDVSRVHETIAGLLR